MRFSSIEGFPSWAGKGNPAMLESISMVRLSAISILLGTLIHLFRFGYSTNLWPFLILTCLMFVLLAYGDNFGFFDKSTGWFRGMYVDEPTPPVVLKAILFVTLVGFCIVFAIRSEGLRRAKVFSERQPKATLARLAESAANIPLPR